MLLMALLPSQLKKRKLTTNIMVVCDDSDLEISPKNATNSKATSVITNNSDEEELAPMLSVGGLSRHQ